MSDIVVLLPGIMGSVLEKDGKEVWTVSAGAVWRAIRSLGGAVQELTLGGDDPELESLGDGVSAPRLLSDIHLMPGLWRIDGYTLVSRSLRQRFGLTPNEDYFEFPYDWRRDNRAHARRLRRESHDWLAARRRQGADDPKLILVAHSMGGLVARAFLELEGGWRDTRALVTFGTPYRGSLNALGFIANGFEKGIGPLSLDLSDMLRSFTSIYQLLPTYTCFDSGDGTLVRPGETDAIPNLDRGRAAGALAFHRQIRDAVAAHRQQQDYLDLAYQTYPVVGYAQPTLQSASVAGSGVELRRDRKGRDEGGDGTVPRPSAIPEELDRDLKRSMFSAVTHGSLQNTEEVLDHLQGILTTDYDPEEYKAAEATLSLDVGDVFGEDEAVVVRVRCSQPGTEAQVRIQDTETSATVASATLYDDDADDGWMEDDLGRLAAGSYRITVTASQATPVSDLLVVF